MGGDPQTLASRASCPSATRGSFDRSARSRVQVTRVVAVREAIRDRRRILANRRRERVQAFILIANSAFTRRRQTSSTSPSRSRLPAIYPYGGYVEESGGFMSYAAESMHDLYPSCSILRRQDS